MIVKRKKDDFLNVKVPRTFIEAVDIRVMSDSMESRAELLRIIGDRIKPTAFELRKKGLLKDDEDSDSFDFIPPQI